MEPVGHGIGYIVALGIIAIIAIPLLILWIKTVVEIIQSDYEGENKVIWLIIVLMAGLMGIILYYIIGRKTRITVEEEKEEIGDNSPRYRK